MIEIRNLLFQPLTLQLAGEEHGLHLGPRQRRLIEDSQVSDDILAAVKRGFVGFTELNQPVEEPVLDKSRTTEEVTRASESDSPESESEIIEQAEETTNEQRSRRRR